MKKKIIWSIVGIVLIGTLSYFGYDYYKNNGTKYEYYDDGTVESKYNLKNGELNGESISYYPNGQIKLIQNWKNGHMYGEHISYFQNGDLQAQYYIDDFSQKGVSYYPNKQIRRQWDSNNKYTEYFENGQINTIGNYSISGQRIGEWNQYDETGNHIATLIYGNGEPYSGNIYTYWYSSDEQGNEVRYLGKMGSYKNGELNGPQYEYYENGNMKLSTNYLNGKEHGHHISYHENGKIYSKYTYVNGKVEGKGIEYYDNGNIETIRNYKDGELNGKFTSYREDGGLRYEKMYLEGKAEGKEIEYDSNGNAIKVYERKDGEIIDSYPYHGS